MHGRSDSLEPTIDGVALGDIRPMWPLKTLGYRATRLAYAANRRRNRTADQRPIASDVMLRDRSIASLKETGVITYTGEFGAEITTFIPFIFWLKAEGLMRGRRVVTFAGMRPYYYFLDDDEYAEKPEARIYTPVARRTWPTNSTYTAVRQAWHVCPDYRARYAGEGLKFSRPVLFVQNKFATEQGKGPINYLHLIALDRLFAAHSRTFDIVYSRPRTLPRETGYVEDADIACDYPDLAVVRRHPHVLDLETWCVRQMADYNLVKLQMLAKSHVFVAVQGGGSHLLACFGESLMLMLDYRSGEFPHSYSLGAYKYLSNPSPILLLARSDRDLDRGLDVLEGVRMVDRGVCVPRHLMSTLQSLRI